MNKMIKYFLFALMLALCACTTPEMGDGQDQPAIDELPSLSEFPQIEVYTDKAMYAPGTSVKIMTNKPTNGLGVRYWHLGDVIKEEALSGSKEWTWTPPAEDYQGYYVEVVAKDANDKLVTLATTAVDVSSEWTRFPRYGYLGRFDDVPELKREKVLSNLNKHHINALQYYEWGYDHHHPLAGTPEEPWETWPKYLATTNCDLDVIQGYIRQGHNYNMVSMFYNLCNGLFESAEEDGCGSDWYIYYDKNHTNKVYHPLDLSIFRSNLYQCDPGGAEWLEWIAAQTADVYKVFDFDGFHIDQLGNIGRVYDYYGKEVDLRAGYGKFIQYMKKCFPDKYHVFNAVSNWGQEKIAAAPVDILYNEVWGYNFKDLKSALDFNRSVDPNRNTVLPAYIHSRHDGYFNTPSVLFLDAVIFAMGGSHLELGENLICDIYWPACELKVHPELEEALLEYYDFLVGYENILRDGVKECKINVTSPDVNLCYWQPSVGSVNVYATQGGGRTMVHFLNFKDAAHLNWHDAERTQTEPKLITNFEVTVPCFKKPSRVWAASPDSKLGAPVELEFVNNGTSVTVKVPSLKYWTMLVVE